jgi:hypothetical protein
MRLCNCPPENIHMRWCRSCTVAGSANFTQALSTFKHKFKAKRKIFQSRLEHSLECVRCSFADILCVCRQIEGFGAKACGLLTHAVEPLCATCCTETQPLVEGRSSIDRRHLSDTRISYLGPDLHDHATIGTRKCWLFWIVAINVISSDAFAWLIPLSSCSQATAIEQPFLYACRSLSTRNESYFGPKFCSSWLLSGLDLIFHSRNLHDKACSSRP